MLRFLILAILLFSFVAVALTLIVSALVCLALAAVIGLPIYLFLKPKLERRGMIGGPQTALERLKSLYVDGKIDLFEFERRAASLITYE
jgi:hypothetical protein